jgi:hypothetical protein
MLKKLFFSLLVRLGWTWQMIVPATACVLFFVTALATGNRVPGPRRGMSDRNEYPSGDRTVTQRYQWGHLSSRNSA